MTEPPKPGRNKVAEAAPELYESMVAAGLIVPDAPIVDHSWDCDDGDGDGCYLCGGSGSIVTCIDDMCRNAGECMHGDGEAPCPNCQ